MPSTRFGRFSFVLVLVATAFAVGLAWVSRPQIGHDRYYFTLRQGPYSNFVQAPARVTFEPIPTYGSMAWEYFDMRCSMEKLSKAGAKPAKLIYRARELCNAAPLAGADFEEAERQFKIFIDREITEDFMVMARHYAAYIAIAISLCLVVISLAWAGIWISKGASRA